MSRHGEQRVGGRLDPHHPRPVAPGRASSRPRGGQVGGAPREPRRRRAPGRRAGTCRRRRRRGTTTWSPGRSSGAGRRPRRPCRSRTRRPCRAPSSDARQVSSARRVGFPARRVLEAAGARRRPSWANVVARVIGVTTAPRDRVGRLAGVDRPGLESVGHRSARCPRRPRNCEHVLAGRGPRRDGRRRGRAPTAPASRRSTTSLTVSPIPTIGIAGSITSPTGRSRTDGSRNTLSISSSSLSVPDTSLAASGGSVVTLTTSWLTLRSRIEREAPAGRLVGVESTRSGIVRCAGVACAARTSPAVGPASIEEAEARHPLVVEDLRQVAAPGIREEHDDEVVAPEVGADDERGVHRGAARPADEQPFFSGDAARRGERLRVAHHDGAVDERRVVGRSARSPRRRPPTRYGRPCPPE